MIDLRRDDLGMTTITTHSDTSTWFSGNVPLPCMNTGQPIRDDPRASDYLRP